MRKIFGWKRFDSPKAVAAMNDLYAKLARRYHHLDPFALVASIERKIAEIEALPSAPIRKCPGHGPNLRNLSARSTARHAAFEDAPVRSYVAR